MEAAYDTIVRMEAIMWIGTTKEGLGRMMATNQATAASILTRGLQIGPISKSIDQTFHFLN